MLVYSCFPRLEVNCTKYYLRFDKGKPDQSQRRKATGPRFLRDAFCYATKDPKIAGLPIVLTNPTEELIMWKKLIFCLPILLFVGALIVPASFAAEKSDFTASELFNPLPLPGFPAPQIGAFIALPTIACPGHEPTGDQMQPCPVGSRTHLRNNVLVSRVDSTDPKMSGWMTVELNANMDADFAGPVWGTFSIAIDSGGTWEGTWQGLRVRVAEEEWTATLHVQGRGFGGAVDGMKLMAADEIVSPTPVAIAYWGSIQGRIVDPN